MGLIIEPTFAGRTARTISRDGVTRKHRSAAQDRPPTTARPRRRRHACSPAPQVELAGQVAARAKSGHPAHWRATC